MIYGNVLKKILEDNVDVLNEVTITKCKGYKITLDGPGKTDQNFSEDPYIKIYNSENGTASDPCARINLKDGHYVIHNSSNGKSALEFNSKMKKEISKILNSKPVKPYKELEDCENCLEAINKANKILSKGKKCADIKSLPENIGYYSK